MSSPPQPPAKRRRLDLTVNITVLIGHDKQKFEVPKTFLAKSSDFFKTCCNGSWSEATSRTIDMSETNPDHFGMYLQWLYTGEIVIGEHTEEGMKGLEGTKLNQIALNRYSAIFNLAVLSEYIQDASFSNEVVDAFIKTEHTTELGPSAARLANHYEKLAEKSPFRRLLVDWFAGAAAESVFHSQKKAFPDAAIWDILMRLKQSHCGHKLMPLSWRKRCDDHQHGQGSPSCV